VVRHRDDYDFVAIENVDDVVLETAQAEGSGLFRNGLPCQRVLSQQFQRIEKIPLETLTEAIPLIIEVRGGFANLGVSSREQPHNGHRRRARRRANTSSTVNASMLPALYSANRRSPSSAHS